MRNFLLVLVAAVAVFAIVGCGGNDEPAAAAPTGYAPNQSVEAYAYTHGGYVGQAVVTTDAEGNIDVTLDEAFLPHTLAIVNYDAPEWTEDNTVFYIQRGNEVRVARWISYAGTNYTGVTVGGALAYVESGENGEPTGATILEKAIIRNQNTMAAWYDNIADGQFMIYTEFGGAGEAVTTTSYGSLFKRGSTYWSSGELGWSGNIEAIEEAAETIGTGFSVDEMAKPANSNFWALADAVTGATASDFIDYFNVIQNAVGRLKMQ